MAVDESVLQALGALEWVLVQLVLNVRTRTAVALRQDLAEAGIDIPVSIIESGNGSEHSVALLRLPSISTGSEACSAIGSLS